MPSDRVPGAPDWLTLGQAARFLGVAQSTIRAWSDQGDVPTFTTPGGHRRYRRADLEAFLERSGRRGRAEARPVVLVVDDDPRTRELVCATLEREGYGVRAAGSAAEGAAAIEQGRTDLILLDVGMPEADGWELLRRLQERGGAAAIPIVTFGGSPAGEQADLRRLVDQTRRLLPVG